MKDKEKIFRYYVGTSKENLHVYDTLRNEIIQMEESQMTYTVYMYTVFFAVFAFGLKYRILFLLAQIVLIIFQSLINYRVWLRHKVSAYIITFFETPRNDIHWESLHHSSEYIRAEADRKHLFSMWIAEHAAGALACITALIEIYFIFLEIRGNGGIFLSQVSWKDIYIVFEIFLSLLFCIAVLVTVYEYDHARDPMLKQIMDKYRREQFKN